MKKIFFTIICWAFVLNITSAQQYGAFGELIEEEKPFTKMISNKEANTIKGGEQKTEQYTTLSQLINYKIELTHSKYPLDLHHRIFQLYKKVSFNQTPSLGFTYYTGSFTSEIAALEYLERNVLAEFPKAKIVKERKYLK